MKDSSEKQLRAYIGVIDIKLNLPKDNVINPEELSAGSVLTSIITVSIENGG